jgi:hypothetical protein
VAGLSYQANDVLTVVSYALLERPLFATLPGNIAAGVRTVAIVDRAIYAGAQIIVGVVGGNQEIVTISSVSATDFTATFANAHSAGEVVKGATFPGGRTLQGVTANVAAGAATAPLFTQAEVLQYLFDVQNAFLEATRCVYRVNTVNLTGGLATAALPADCIRMERVGIAGVALWPMAQAEIDLSGNGTVTAPVGWYLDRQNAGLFAVDPPSVGSVVADVVYSQKGTALPVLTDSLIAPDGCWPYLVFGVLASAFSKEGEMRDARRAAYCAKRYERGVQYVANYMKQLKMSPGFGKG